MPILDMSRLMCLSALLSVARCATASVYIEQDTHFQLGKRTDSPNVNQKWSYFAAVGDSYAAGPGAGDPYSTTSPAGGRLCIEQQLAYPQWLVHASEFEKPHGSTGVHFISCDGTKFDAVEAQQLAAIDQNAGLVTMTAGLFDSGIASALSSCIFGFDEPSNPCATSHGNQTQYLAAIEAGIFSNSSSDDYFALIDKLHTALAWSGSDGTAVYQNAYPQLFDDNTTQCSSISFGYPSTNPTGQKLTQDLRLQLNLLVQEVNVLHQYWIDQVNYNYNASYPVDFMRSANQDQLFTGHRFCRNGTTEPDRDNQAIYFFNLLSETESGTFSAGDSSSVPTVKTTLTNDSNGTVAQYASINPDTCSYLGSSDTLTSNLECLTARAIEHGYAGPLPDLITGTKTQNGTNGLAKVLHPRALGHALTGSEVAHRSQYVEGSKDFGVPLRVLSVGDSITVGFRSTNITADSGYREPLYNILSKNNDNVTFIGSQHHGTAGPWALCEGYSGNTTQEIRQHLLSSGSLQHAPNVIILMAGTNDVRVAKDWSVLEEPASQLEGMIQDIFNADPHVALLVAHIPAIGHVFSADILAVQRLVIKWNANINVIVNRMKAQNPGWRIRYVHTSTTVYDHYPGDGLHPSDRGYIRLATDFAEGLSTLALYQSLAAPA